MKRDFTFLIYRQLIETAKSNGYKFTTVKDFVLNKSKYIDKTIILKHDVDRKPDKALTNAIIEEECGIKTSYYFRTKKNLFNRKIICKIAALGHEIGYHYEDLSACNGNYKKAILMFENNLNKFRDSCQVKTMCMHGSPLSKYDNKMLWEEYEYQSYGIIADANRDLDFNIIYYVTDTGRAWNKNMVSIRDKVDSSVDWDVDFRTTVEFLKALNEKKLPGVMLINTHPQRWSRNNIEWFIEIFMQSAKNIIKERMVRKRMRNVNKKRENTF